jgi:hypothetical protein
MEMRQIAGTIQWVYGLHGGRSVPVGGEISKEVAKKDSGKRAQGSLAKNGGSIAVQPRFFFFFFLMRNKTKEQDPG